MKTILVTFAVLLFLLTLLGSFGGSIYTNEPFFDAVPAVKEEQLLRGPSMVNQINDVLNMATNGTAPNFSAMLPESYENFPVQVPPQYPASKEAFYEEKLRPVSQNASQPASMEAFYQGDEKIDTSVPEPFETDVAGASPF